MQIWLPNASILSRKIRLKYWIFKIQNEYWGKKYDFERPSDWPLVGPRPRRDGPLKMGS